MDARLLHVVRPDVRAELASLVAKMMAKEPGRRFQAPAEIATALAPFFKKEARNLASSSFTDSEVTAPAADLIPAEIDRPSIAAAAAAD
jgi:hypothetical protein